MKPRKFPKHPKLLNARWWFQWLFIFTPILGEDEAVLTHIFHMDWFNHQLECDVLIVVQEGKGTNPKCPEHLGAQWIDHVIYPYPNHPFLFMDGNGENMVKHPFFIGYDLESSNRKHRPEKDVSGTRWSWLKKYRKLNRWCVWRLKTCFVLRFSRSVMTNGHQKPVMINSSTNGHDPLDTRWYTYLWKMNDCSYDILCRENTTWYASPPKSCGISCRNNYRSLICPKHLQKVCDVHECSLLEWFKHRMENLRGLNIWCLNVRHGFSVMFV